MGAASPRVAPDVADDGTAEVRFVDAEGLERQEPLEDCLLEPFEAAQPVRPMPSYWGQRNWPGWYWSATTGRHVGYESWLERDHAIALDFDPDVVAFAAKPCRLLLRVDGRVCWHVPDFFARNADGTAKVVDCRPDDRVGSQDAAVFEAAERVCAMVGWNYRAVGNLPATFAENLRWLSGYRHPRFAVEATAQRLRAAFAVPRPVMDGASRCGPSAAVLPVLFHLLWHGRLRTELSAPLSETSQLIAS